VGKACSERDERHSVLTQFPVGCRSAFSVGTLCFTRPTGREESSAHSAPPRLTPQTIFALPYRTIRAPFGPQMPEEAHGYCDTACDCQWMWCFAHGAMRAPGSHAKIARRAACLMKHPVRLKPFPGIARSNGRRCLSAQPTGRQTSIADPVFFGHACNAPQYVCRHVCSSHSAARRAAERAKRHHQMNNHSPWFWHVVSGSCDSDWLSFARWCPAKQNPM
jgi:hypothetical protein